MDGSEKKLLIEQAKLLQHQMGGLLVLNMVVGVIILLTLINLMAPFVPLVCFGCLCVYTLMRFFYLKKMLEYPLRADNVKKRLRTITFLSGLSGVLWGIFGFVLPVFDNTHVMIITTILLCGLISGSVQTLSLYKPAYYAFAIPTLLPFSLLCLLSGEPIFITTGVLCISFLVVNMVHCYFANSAQMKAVVLTLENEGLIERLTKEKANAEEAREAAVRNARVKTKFLAAASHDLRQPLHAMGFFVEALINQATSEKVRDLIYKISQTSNALRGLLRSILDISRIEAGAVETKVTHFYLDRVLSEIGIEFLPLAAEKGLSLEIETAPHVIYSDEQILLRILRNLISNALVYTEKGFIHISCVQEGEHLLISVQDSGIGIADDMKEEIYQEFFQVDNPERDRVKGLGLGLSIVEGLCELLNYEVRLETEVGKGSVFSVLVPMGDVASVVEKQTEEDIWSHNGTPMKIIVIDDDAQSCTAMKEIFDMWGHKAEVFETSEAAEIFIKDGDFEPDVIISDYRLRENKTGVEAIEQIQKKINGTARAIIVTGDTDEQRIAEAKASGYALLHKPVHPAKLRSVITYLTSS